MSAQVQVTVHTSKTAYLAGEPVYAIVHIQNVGPDPVAYSGCDGQVSLGVPDAAKTTGAFALGLKPFRTAGWLDVRHRSSTSPAAW